MTAEEFPENFCPTPFLAGREKEVPIGEYRLIEGTDSPIQFDPLDLREVGSAIEVFPGVRDRGEYHFRGFRRAGIVVSFLYHKTQEDGSLETSERVIVLGGYGYGVLNPGHTGQAPSWYLIGPQIGTLDPQTGVLTTVESGSDVPAKAFSIACITNGPLGKPVLTNPPQ